MEGQENPITNLVIMSEVWTELSDEQQEALTAAVDTAATEVTDCVAEDEESILDRWRDGDEWEVVEDIRGAAE